MKISKQSRRDAKQLLQSCKVQGVLDESRVRQVVAAVVARKPRGTHAILTHFQRLVRLETARHTALVESAVPLVPALQSDIAANLSQVYGSGLQLSFAQNAALIGGLRVKVGSDVFDGSIRARLAQLGENT